MIEMHGTVKNLPLLSCALADVNGQKRGAERVIKNATHRSNSPVSGKMDVDGIYCAISDHVRHACRSSLTYFAGTTR
jgi:hypothetical protein